MSGSEIAHTIYHSHCFSPCRATAIPPNIPPNISPIMPTVPCVNPICSVVMPNPPSETGSSRKGMLILVSCASGNRYRSMNNIAIPACSFRKNERNVSKNSLSSPEADVSTAALSFAGRGKIKA